ncbi:MAG: hypothetical protein IPL21_12715 [Saprospirales bacterium]|nr:hypothetical protein [Saprospirales bacterium]
MTITDVTVLNCAGTPSHTTTTVTIIGSCVNVSTTGTSIGTDTVCIVACDASTGICDTTVIITTVPPTQDTIRDTNQIGTTTTVCVPLESGFTPTSGSIINCGHSNNSGNVYSVDNNGCVTITRSNLVGYNLDTICVVVCDAQNNCDTTTVIVSNTPKRDTIRDTICVGCTVDTCINVEQGMTITDVTVLNCAGTPSHTTTTVTIIGSCVNVSTTGTSIGTDTVCIVACDASTGICDTTVIITTVPPTQDTIRDTNQIGTTTTVCVPLEAGFTPTTGSIINCGHSNNSGNVYSVDNNGCVTITRSNVVGYNLDTICVVVCDAQNNCDTTVVIVSNTPKRDTIRDTICVGCTVDTCINVEQGMTITDVTVLNCAGTPSHTTTTVTIIGSCVNVSTTGTSIGTDTVCIVACDASTGICDTTVIITTVPPTQDTIRDTNQIGTTTTVCVPLEAALHQQVAVSSIVDIATTVAMCTV